MGKWEMVRLGDVGTIITGNTPPKKESIFYDSNDIPFFKPNDFSEGTIAKLKIPNEYVSEKARKKIRLLPIGSVLVTCIGTIGKVGIAICESTCNQQINAIIPHDKVIISEYLANAVLKKRAYLKQIANAPVVPIINKSNFSEVKIPLPPLDEQKRIAKNIDLASEIVKGYKEQLAELDKLVQSVFYEMFGDPLLNPFVFPVSTLGNLADVVSGITKGRKLGNSQQLFEVPYMAVSNVKAGYINWTTVKTITATQEEIERYRIFENDILMTEGGDPDKLGRGSIINEVPQNCIHQNHIFRVRCKSEGVIPQYFSEYLKHASAKQYFLRCAKQTTGIASINMTQLRSLSVIVPPLPLQTRFASLVTAIEAQKSRVQHALTEAENLFNSLMQEYFE